MSDNENAKAPAAKPSDEYVVRTSANEEPNENAMAASEQASEQNPDNSAESENKEVKPGDKPGEPYSNTGKQLAKLRRENRQLKQDNESLKGSVDNLTQKVDEVLSKQTSESALPEPQITDYKDTAEFLTAHEAWKKTATPPSKPSQPAQRQVQAEPLPFQDDLDKLSEAGTKEFGDEFAEVMSQPTLPISADMRDWIFDEVPPEIGAKLIMQFDENPEEGRKIAKMRPMRAAKAMAKLAEKFKSDGKDKDKGKAAKQDEGNQDEGNQGAKNENAMSAESSGMSTVNTHGVSPEPDLDKVSTEEYRRIREKQEAEQRSRGM